MTKCYYDSSRCEGEEWQCATCLSLYCQTHFHQTNLGTNVECVACERERMDSQDEEAKKWERYYNEAIDAEQLDAEYKEHDA